MVRALVLAALLASLGCSAAPSMDSSPPVASPPAPTSELPPGALTRALRTSWDGPAVAWQAALVDCLLDPANPLHLSAKERRALVGAMIDLAHNGERVEARRAALYRAGARVWSPVPDRSGLADEDLFLATLARARPALRAAAAGSTASPEPDPDFDMPAPQSWVEEPEEFQKVPGEVQITLGAVASVLPRAAVELRGAEAARFLAEAERMGELVEERQGIWLRLLRLAAAPGRTAEVRRRARQLDADLLDSRELYRRINIWAEENDPSGRPDPRF